MNVIFLGVGPGTTLGANWSLCGVNFRYRGVSAVSMSNDNSLCQSQGWAGAPCEIFPSDQQGWATSALSAVLAQGYNSPSGAPLPWEGSVGGITSLWVDQSSHSVINSCIADPADDPMTCMSYYGFNAPGIPPATSIAEFGRIFADGLPGDLTFSSQAVGIAHYQGLLATPVPLTYGVVQFAAQSYYNPALDDSHNCNDVQITILQACQKTLAPNICLGCGTSATGGEIITIPLPANLSTYFPSCTNSNRTQPTAAVYCAAFQINPDTDYGLDTVLWGTSAFKSVDDFITNSSYGIQAWVDNPIQGWPQTIGTCPLEDDPA